MNLSLMKHFLIHLNKLFRDNFVGVFNGIFFIALPKVLNLIAAHPASKMLALLPIIFMINCGGKTTEVVTESLTLNFKADINDVPIEFSTGRYNTAASNEISIDRIKFYMSNISLHNSNKNSSIAEADSYHLISLDADNNSFSFTINDIPDGFEFDQIQFAIGVDSDKNFSPDNTGDLDPANDMAWSWTTGYKFFKMEGNYYPSGADTKGLVLHIGHDKNYKQLSIDLNGLKQINGTANIHFTLDALAPLAAPNQIDLSLGSDFQAGETSDNIAENYAAGLIKSVTTDL